MLGVSTYILPGYVVVWWGRGTLCYRRSLHHFFLILHIISLLLLYKIMFGPWNYSDLYCKSIIFENRVDLCTMYGHIVSSQT